VLEQANAGQAPALQASPAGVSTEQVLVFETSRPVKEFVDAIKSRMGWIGLQRTI